jgi:lipoprotein LprG
VAAAALMLLTGWLTGWLTACSGSGSGPAGTSSAKPSAAEFVARAKTTLDATSAVHFVLSSAGLPQAVTALVGGEGDAARPDKFAGDLDVSLSGGKAKVSVVSIGGTVHVKLPFTTTYTVTDPKKFNIPDPGSFMSPTAGLTQLLAQATNATDSGQTRAGGAVLQTVVADVPGRVVDAVLRDADPAAPVKATFGIDPATNQLRTATLVGPFFEKGVSSSYTLALSKYGAPVDIRVPTG